MARTSAEGHVVVTVPDGDLCDLGTANAPPTPPAGGWLNPLYFGGVPCPGTIYEAFPQRAEAGLAEHEAFPQRTDAALPAEKGKSKNEGKGKGKDKDKGKEKGDGKDKDKDKGKGTELSKGSRDGPY